LRRIPAAVPDAAPERLVPGVPADRARLVALLSSGAVAFLHDGIESQLGELVEARNADRKLSDVQRRALVAQHLCGCDPRDYGVWVHYPWSKRLVHVLPPAEFREVRTSRNRNKITSAEQARLAELDIAIVGLSVGRATALTLALEGVGGRLRLADFDALELSNLNRLRAGLHEIGVNKAVSTAREIFEVDPYIEIAIAPHGVRPDDVDSFLLEPRRVDVLVEECDDLQMKVLLRERARAHRIPVVMETSDRGMIDIERFDLEPERPLFHGLVPELRAEQLEGLDTYAKVPIVLAIIGAETMSRRLAASLVDVESTLETWPQLASAVALGGALNTDTVRRIALGQFCDSGRYWVDLEQVVRWPAAPERAVALAPAIARGDRATVPPTALPTDELALPPVDAPWPVLARALVAHAVLAPSGGNAQPWRFEAMPGRLRCCIDPARAHTLLDFEHRASRLACGAAAMNAELAAAAIGGSLTLELAPDPDDLRVVWDAHWSPAPGAPMTSGLFEFVAQRVTNRRLGTRVPLASEHAQALAREAGAAGADLVLWSSESELERIAALLGECEQVRMTTERLHKEMLAELRFTPAEVLRTRDGLDLETLELDATERAGLAVTRQWSVMATLREVGGPGLARPTRKAIAAASAVGLVVWPERGAVHPYIAGGRALQRVWLRAHALGLAVQPISSLLYLVARIDAGAPELGPRDAERLRALAQRFASVFGRRSGTDLLLFRLAVADPPRARSLRRPVDAVLRLDGAEPS
jgi:molybdopterin/thiamine biosynthesis adenylyltransferase/nitroreductase